MAILADVGNTARPVRLVCVCFWGLVDRFHDYVPVRNLFCPRIIEGTLETVSAAFTDKGKPVLSIKLNQLEFLVPNLGDLDKVVTNPDLQWQKLRFSLRAFNRVLRVDKLS